MVPRLKLHGGDSALHIADILGSAQGGQAMANLATAFGVDPAVAEKAVGAVLPRISDRIERNTLSRGGIADLISMLGKPGVSAVLDDPKALTAPETEKLGIDVLDQVVWNKDGSRTLAAKAARQSGVSEDLIKKMLPAIAALAIGGLAKGSSGALGEILSKLNGSPLPLPGEAPAETPRRTPASVPQTGSGDVGRQSPLPIPGDNVRRPRRSAREDEDDASDGGDNPYGDLGDIIRRGGHQIPGGNSGTGGVDAGSLGGLVRQILGNLLGFENRGFMGWVVNLVLIKILLPVIQRVLSRVVVGR